MSELPTTWTSAKISEFADTSSGGTPSRMIAAYYGGSIPWVKSGELNDGTVRTTEETITDDGLANSSAKVFPKGTVCIALYGATVGRLGILDFDGATNQAVCGIHPHQSIDRHYLFYFLLSQRSNLISQSQGGAQPNISQGIVRDTEVPISPSSEQLRVVEEIEKQFSRLDAATAALKRVQAKLKRYRASVLKATYEGRLVPTEAELARKESREYEPADMLLERILRERRVRWEADALAKMIASGKPPKDDGWKRKYKEPATPTSSGLPELPEGWCWASFDQVAWRVRSGTAETSGRETTGYPVLKSSAVRPGRIDFSDVNFLRPDQSKRSDNFIKTDDLLVTRLSGSLEYVAQCAFVEHAPPQPVQYPDRLFCAKLVGGISGQFLTYCFQHQPLRAAMEQAAKSTAGHQRISMSDLFKFRFPLPPLNEQNRIASALDRQFSFIDRLRTIVRNDGKRADHTRQSILMLAFSGKLVSQYPSDEPASVLLERIRAERSATGPETVARRRKQELVHA